MQVENPKPFRETLHFSENNVFERLGTAVGEIVHDIREANNRAKKKFGKSAALQAGEGLLTVAVGAGLEVATNAMFDKAWKGEGPIFERFVMGADAGKRLADFSAKHPRLAHFIKESTQDVALAALYNFIAFRSQPIFNQVESSYVLGSIAVNAFEAGLNKSVRGEMHEAAARIQAGSQPRAGQRGRWFGAEQSYTAPVVAPDGWLAALADLSNPPTLMGLWTVKESISEFVKQWKEIQQIKKLEKWSGGKAGIKQGGEHNVYFGSSKTRYNNKRREYEERFDDM